MRACTLLIVLALAVPAEAVLAGETVLFDMETQDYNLPVDKKTKAPRGSAKSVPGKVGQAVEFTFQKDCRSAYFTSHRKRANAAWDQAAGVSFWVKGDGSDKLGSIELIDDSFANRYAISFPLNHTDWKKVVVPWRDIIPEMAKAPFVDPAKGFKPSQWSTIWIGKFHFWRDFGAHSFAIDQFALEDHIELQPTPAPPAGDPLAKTKQKLAAGEPVTILALGDSLTDPKHWANKNATWMDFLKTNLAAQSKSKITMHNYGLGGRELKHLLILMPEWVDKAKPDLVTVCFGYNDFSSGMRGAHFKETQQFAVDKIRRACGAEVLLMTPSPALERWTQMEELAVAVREAAKDRRAGLAEVYDAMHAAGDADEVKRAALFVRDKTHLADPGKKIVAQAVLKALIAR